MEDNNTTTENNKLSYEQLEQVAIQLNQKVMQAEARLASINLTAMRIEFLFKVLDKSQFFSFDFVNKCSAEIENLMEVKKEDDNIKSEE